MAAAMFRFKPVPTLTLLGSVAMLIACAGDSGRYPSLAIRDVERVEGTFDVEDTAPVTPPAPEAPSAELSARLAQLVDQARGAHAKFQAGVPAASRLAAAAPANSPESNTWQDAQVALASLESHRSSAAIPLGDLDLLYADAAIELAQRQAIDAARAEVVALVEQEDAVLTRLRAQISQ